MGIEGTTLASFCTNLLVLITNIYLTNITRSLKKANKVSIFDKRVFKNFDVYLSISIPCMMILILDWSCFEVSSLMAGFMGVN
jgi:hypothetical protein